MRKIWTLAWKEVYTTFTDRNSVLIMIVTPLAISIIIGLAFSGFGAGDVPIQDIPTAVVNLDRASASGISFGQVFVTALVPDTHAADRGGDAGQIPACDLLDDEGGRAQGEANGIDLFELTDAVLFDAAVARGLVDDGVLDPPDAAPESDAYVEAAARAAVEKGEYTAAILIPPDFTQKISYIPGQHPQLEQTGVTVYANSGRLVSGQIVRSIVEAITNQILTGNIAMAATFAALEGASDAGPAGASPAMDAAFGCAFNPASNTIRLQRRMVEGSQESNTSVQVLVMFGSAQAMFFALFTAGFGVLSMYDDRRNWTLQRLIISPTPRTYILVGKLIGVALTVLFQLLVLLIALTAVGSVLGGELRLIWGTDPLLVGMVLLSATLAVSGFGMFMAGIAKNPEQGQIFGSVFSMGLAVLGGTFGFTLPRQVAVLSLIYWGRDAFQILARGDSDVGLHIVVLAVQGAALYGLGVLFFNRRFEA